MIDPIKQEIKATKSYNQYLKLKETIKQQNVASILKKGKLLKQIKEAESFKKMGYKTFAEFLKDPEINLYKSQAYCYIFVYEFYAIRLGLTAKKLANFYDLDELVLFLQWMEKAELDNKTIIILINNKIKNISI